MNERVDEVAPKKRKCRFFKGDIVRVKLRPDNPTEVLMTAELPHHDWVMFLMDKRTLKGEFRYDDDDQVELVRRASADTGASRDGPVRAGDRRPKGTNSR